MNKFKQNIKCFNEKKARGLTILELLLVVGIIGVFAASSAPYVMRSVGWMHQTSEIEQDFYRLYEATLLISRYVGNGGQISTIKLVSGELKANGVTMVKNVKKWEEPYNLGKNTYRCDLTIEGSSGEQSLRFVVLQKK
jgi:type II secretory pathway pseudopilin PulG